jgi:hypothetical protein
MIAGLKHTLEYLLLSMQSLVIYIVLSFLYLHFIQDWGEISVSYQPPNEQPWQQPPNTSYPPQQPPQYQTGGLPPPPVQPPPKKTNGCLIVTVVVVEIIVALFICGTIGSSFVTGTASSPNATATADANNAVATTDTPVPTDTATSTAVVSSYTPPPTQAPAKWTTTHNYTGSGIKKTAIFTAPDDWKIVWKCNPSSFYGSQYNVQVLVYNSDGTIADLAINELCKNGNTSGETEEHQGGDVYLDINSEGDWTIQVQELK